MRTKQYLAALCLPLAFAACSDEEYVTDSPLLGSRGTINVTLNATKPGFDDVNTRIVMDGDNFKWEKDVDMIGAAMVDNTPGTVDNDIRVNYPFIAQSSAATSAFNSKSAISGGLYLFYYSYADHLITGGLDMSVPAQKYDVALASAKDGKDAKQQAVGYMKMISPIVNLSQGVKYEDAQDYNLNLSFVNLYTMAKVIISSKNIKEGTTPKLKKVTLNANSGQGFVKTATVDMEKIAAKSSKNANVVVPEEATKQIKDEDMAKAIEAIETLVGGAVDNTPSAIYASASRTLGAAELSIEGDLALSETAETEVYILVPKGKYNAGLKLTVETTEGVYEKTISKPKEGDLILANQIQQMSASLDFNSNVEAPKKFSIGSTDDWNNAIEFINTHTGSYLGALPTFNLTEDVTIASLPAYAVKVKADAAKTLTFTEDFTLANGGKMLDADGGDNVTLCVASGATLTLNDASGFAIQNNGTLNVNANQTKKITNLGTMNVGGEAAVSLSAGLDNGKEAVTNPVAAAIEGTISIPAGKSLTIATAALENNVGTITVDGTLTISQASTNSDKIIVDAKGILTGGGVITNGGTIENSGTLTISAAMANADGTFVIKNGSKGGNSGAINNGTVIVETGTKLPESAEAYTFGSSDSKPVVSTEVTTNEEYAAVKDVAAITNIILSKQAEWTIGGSGLAAPSATSLTLNSVKLIVGAEMTGKSIIVEGGASTITAASELSIKGNVALEVKQGATLTVEKNVTFNEAKNNIDAKTAIATILGTLKVEAGAALYFATAKVGSKTVKDATLTVAGNITTGGSVAAGVFGVNGVADTPANFKNWGTISSLTGETAGASNAGQISAAQAQSETAVVKGLGANATVTFEAAD